MRVLPLAMVDDINAISECGLDSVNLNTFINSQMELKKLRFHVPDMDGKSKCHKMHVGRKKEMCPELRVHGTVMETVTEDMYLGDLISSDGKNKKNVEKRISKGLGIITQVINLLETISFGQHYIEIALLLRESLFLNGILFNAEVWYGMTKFEVNEFEKLDRLLLRRIFQVPVSTPQEAYYLELGILPIGVIIKKRRLQYLHHLANREEKEMLHQFFITQWNKPSKGDWTETAKENMEEFGLQADLGFLKSKSKSSFKNILKKKAIEYAFEELTEKQAKHSKMENLQYSELAIQNYFLQPGINIDEIRSIFKYRTRMAPFGENFRAGRESVTCPLCSTHVDSQVMSFMCPAIRKNINIDCDIQDLYTDTMNMKTASTVSYIIKLRREILETEA